jgi:hypothetical protein
MKILIFSNTKNIEKSFAGLTKDKGNVIQVAPAAQLKKTAKKIETGSLVYADLSSFGKAEVPLALKLLAKLEGSSYAVIDPKGAVTDVAGLFRAGAADYLTAPLLKKGVPLKRLEEIMKFKNIEAPNEKLKALTKNYIPSGSDWKKIQTGKEYTFCFMLVELDNKSDLKSTGPEQFSRITSAFRQYIEGAVTPLNGRIWIWMDFGGLVLFPFDGKKCDAIESAFRLMLDRKLMSATVVQLDINLEYRIAVHIGNTVYKSKGETGNIISDSINSVFHLGQKYAEEGCFYITDDAFLFTPAGLMNMFVPAGTYEGRNILRMRKML